MRRLAILIAMLLYAAPAFADQTVIPNYRSARDTYFYNQLYPGGGWTLYCGARFEDRTGLNVEHVYAASWMKETAGCAGESRERCRQISDRFNRMEADLHNLYPSLDEINRARSNHLFGMIDGEDREFGSCDFERDTAARIAEPRPIARGNVARSIFYMHTEYGAPIDPSMVDLLRRWHCEDPPSAQEHRRNNTIEVIQATRNPFVDNPRIVSCTEVDSAAVGSTLLEELARGVAPAPNISQPAAAACCKICRKGKACGDSCIARWKTCRKGPGCACDAQ